MTIPQTSPNEPDQSGKSRKKRSRRRRDKGAGYIYLSRGKYRLRLVQAGSVKTFPLRNPDGTSCTQRLDAEKAADSFRKVLLADTKQEVVNFMAEVKQLKRQTGLSLANVWEAFLKQPTRTECAESTEKKYEGQFKAFTEWISKEHPEIELVSQVDRDVALDFMRWLWGTGVSANTFNKYTMALRLFFKHLKE